MQVGDGVGPGVQPNHHHLKPIANGKSRKRKGTRGKGRGVPVNNNHITKVSANSPQPQQPARQDSVTKIPPENNTTTKKGSASAEWKKIVVRMERGIVADDHTFRLVSGYTFSQLLGDCKRHWGAELGFDTESEDFYQRLEFQDIEGCTWPLAGVIAHELSEADLMPLRWINDSALSKCKDTEKENGISEEGVCQMRLPFVRLVSSPPRRSLSAAVAPRSEESPIRIPSSPPSSIASSTVTACPSLARRPPSPDLDIFDDPPPRRSARSRLRRKAVTQHENPHSATSRIPLALPKVPKTTTVTAATTTTTTTIAATETMTSVDIEKVDIALTTLGPRRAESSPELDTLKLSDTPVRKRAGIKLVKSNAELCIFDTYDNAEITTRHPLQETRLLWQVSPKRVLLIKKPNDAEITAHLNLVAKWLIEEKEMEVLVEPGLEAELPHLKAFNLSEQTLAEQVDFIVTLGGDGTILYVNSLFSAAIPPILSFNLGSLGFLTPFHFADYKNAIESAINGSFYITLRQRLQAQIFRADEEGRTFEALPPYNCMNEVVIDRGPGSYLCSLECYCDNILITTLQADGIIVSTTTGSTAYSLSAGGTMVHPIVEGICFTPICPHSLSCRPIMFPNSVTLKIRVPEIARGSAWVSCDGRARHELRRHDYILLKPSKWPVPCINKTDHIGDWFKSLCECLNWNDRRAQKAFPTEGLPAKETKKMRMSRTSSFSLNT